MRKIKLNREKWIKFIKSGEGLSVECGVRPREELLIELPKEKEKAKKNENR